MNKKFELLREAVNTYKVNHCDGNKNEKELLEFIDELEQLTMPVFVSSFLENLKASDSQALLEMRERNQEEFIKWCVENPHAGVDDKWQNEIMFIRDVAKYIEDLVV